MKKIDTPELDKLVKVRYESQKIGEFLDWLSSQGIELAEWSDTEYDDGQLYEIRTTKEQLLAKYFCINLEKAEKERQAILDNIRRENEENVS